MRLIFFIILFIVAGSLSLQQAQACQTEKAGCSNAYPCCDGLTCVISSSIWGFCQNTSIAVTSPTFPLDTTKGSAITPTTKQSGSTIATVSTWSTAIISMTSAQKVVCQVEGTGCSDSYPCCVGLTCVITSNIWGFCQNTTATLVGDSASSTSPSVIPGTSSQSSGSSNAESTLQAQTCQAEGVGCSDAWICCAGLSCIIESDIWGFCVNVSIGVRDHGTTTPATVPGAMVTQAQFNNAVTSSQSWYPVPTADQYVNFVKRATPVGNITDTRELAMFLANILVESAGLTAKREMGPPPASWYVYPPMDVQGQTYYGRGYIQLTWSYNYGSASQALYKDNRLLTNSDQVATNETIAWDVSYWYWSARVHNLPGISEGKFGVSIKAINGGIECGPNAANKASPQTRWEIYQKVFAAFGVAGTPDEHGCWD